MDHCKLPLAFSILFLSLRALGVQGACEQISVVKSWRGGYSVHFNIPIADNMSSWTMDITFSPPVKYVKSWGAKSFTSDGKVLHLSSYPHTLPLVAGSVLKFGFNVSHPPADPAPDMVAVIFNDRYICKGEIEAVDRTKTTARPTTTVPLTTEEPSAGTDESATEELPASTDEPATEEPSITADVRSSRNAKQLLAEEPHVEEISTSTTTTTTTITPTTTTKRTTSTNTTTKSVRNTPTTTKTTRKPPTTKAARRSPTTKRSRKSSATKATRKSPTPKPSRRPSNPRATRKLPATKRKSPATTRKPTPSTTRRPTTKPTTNAASRPIIPIECHSVAQLLQSDPYRFMILFHIPFANYTKDWLFQVDFSGDYHCLSTIPYANIGHSNLTLHSSSVQSAGSVYDGLLVEVLYGRTRPLVITSMLLNGKSICGAGATAKATGFTPAYPFRLSLKQDWHNTRCPGQV